MAWHSLGVVAPASTTTGLPATQNRPDPSKHYPCQAISFQALRTNTAVVLICDTPTPDLVTGAGILVELPIPSSSSVIPLFSVGNPSAPAPLQANQVYILPTVSGEGARISTLVT